MVSAETDDFERGLCYGVGESRACDEVLDMNYCLLTVPWVPGAIDTVLEDSKPRS